MSISDITACIKTFERPDACRQAINALWARYPDLKIMVGDDSKEAHHFEGVEYLRLPYDIGLSAGRNRMIDACKTLYALIMDDDMIAENVDLLAMLEVLRETDAFMVAPEKLTPAGSRNTGSTIRRKGNTFYMDMATDCGSVNGTRYVRTGFIPNFILAETEVFQIVPWTEELKLSEHYDWCLRWKAVMDDLYEGALPFVLCYDMHFYDLGARPGGYGKQRRSGGRTGASLWRKRSGIKKVVRWQDGVTGRWDYEKQEAV